MSPPPQNIGGSFAPPLTDAKIASYKAAITALPLSPVKDACEVLLTCCEKWWELPEPNGTEVKPHPVGRGQIVSLQSDHAEALEPHIPWKHEIEGMKVLFDGISNETQKPLRDMAHHLLWHVIELDLEREPITADRL